MSTAKKQPQQKKGGGGGGKSGEGKAAGKGAAKAATRKAADTSEDVRRDQKLQAILLADSFTTTFRPVTLESPKVLLPLVNVPMIDYTIEFLTQNGIEEIVVFCGWFADKLEAYLKSSRWVNMVSIRCVSSSSCSSAGDALRELDGMNIIRSDPFVLISGDVVANINLKKAIAFHKQKRKEDSNNIMTLALKKVQRCGGSKPLCDDLVVGMNRQTAQVVIFDDNVDNASVHLPIELMESASELVFQTDLLDCNVDICSPELLLQFSDNFDYQDIRKDFIRNEVCNHALGKHIYGYVIENEYAARVQDPRTYHSISRDIVTRWTYPLVPDVPLLREGQCTQLKRYVYRDASVKVARTAEVVEEVVIGRHSVIGAAAKIARTIVGERVNIGANSTVMDSHLWNDVRIGDNVSIDHSIVCDRAVIESDCVIPRGCIISFGVTVKQGTRLEPFTRLSNADNWECEGSGSTQRLCSMGADETWKKNLWKVAPQPVDEESDEEEEDEFAMNDQNFGKAIADMVVSALVENHPADSVAMEIKGYKFAQNKTWGDCLKGAARGILEFLADHEWVNMQTFYKRLRELTKKGALGRALLKAMMHEQSAEVELICAVEDFLLSGDIASKLPSGLRFILQVFYDAGLVLEDGVRTWVKLREDEASHSPEKLRLLKDPKVQEFIDWLDSNSEEDEEDEDDDEEEDDSEEDDESDEDSEDEE